jgi:hypothetical protein
MGDLWESQRSFPFIFLSLEALVFPLLKEVVSNG